MRRLLQPKAAIPILLSASLLAFVFSITDVPKVGHYLGRMSPSVASGVFGITIAYMALKWAQFHSFLGGIQVRVSWRQSMAAFVVGEMTLPIPAGIYAQNFVLQRISGADFSRSSGATTAILVSEGAVSLISVVVLGIPGWDVLRYMILALFAIGGTVLLVLLKDESARNLIQHALQAGPFPKAGAGLVEIVRETGKLLLPTGFVRAFPVSAAYLFCLVTGFYLTARGLGVVDLGFVQATAIYLFAVAIVLVSPVSTHLGIIEAGGVGAMQQFGYSSTEALAVMLGFRVLWTGSAWLIGGTTLLALRSEFSRRGGQRAIAESESGSD